MARAGVQTYVFNGTFANAPTFVAATTTTSRWIDGTASGSTTNTAFGWFANPLTNGISAYFDSSNPYIPGGNSLHLNPNGNSNAAAQVVQYSSFGPPVVGYSNYFPSGSTVNWSYAMKTTVNSGSATSGAYLQFIARDNAGNIVTGGTSGTAIQATTGWTVYTGSFTMPTGASQVTPKVVYANTGGAATLNMDVWVSNVEIYSPRTYATSPYRTLPQSQSSSVFFNGSNAKAALNTVTGLSAQTASLSIGCWMKYPAHPFGAISYPGAFSVFGGNGSTTGLQVYYYAAGGHTGQVAKPVISGTVYDGAASSSLVYGSGNSNWMHWVITYNGATMSSYTNSILSSNGSYASVITNSENSLNIGCSGTYASPGSYFGGNICNFFIGPYLTAAQVALIYSSQIYPSGMVGIWMMNEGSGTTLNDTSGNGNNLTLSNGIWSTDVPFTTRTLASGRTNT